MTGFLPAKMSGAFLQELQDIFLRHVADPLVDLFAILEDQQGRDAHDTELACQLGLFVNIDLADLKISAFCGGISSWPC